MAIHDWMYVAVVVRVWGSSSLSPGFCHTASAEIRSPVISPGSIGVSHRSRRAQRPCCPDHQKTPTHCDLQSKSCKIAPPVQLWTACKPLQPRGIPPRDRGGRCRYRSESYPDTITLETPAVDFPSNRQHGLLVTMFVCSQCGYLEFYRTE
jgi:hypothetical protein